MQIRCIFERHQRRRWELSHTGITIEQISRLAQSEKMEGLKAGSRPGAAMECFGMKYTDLAVGLNNELEEIKWGKVADDIALGNLWIAHNDSRRYVIIGDPGVRLGSNPFADEIKAGR